MDAAHAPTLLMDARHARVDRPEGLVRQFTPPPGLIPIMPIGQAAAHMPQKAMLWPPAIMAPPAVMAPPPNIVKPLYEFAPDQTQNVMEQAWDIFNWRGLFGLAGATDPDTSESDEVSPAFAQASQPWAPPQDWKRQDKQDMDTVYHRATPQRLRPRQERDLDILAQAAHSQRDVSPAPGPVRHSARRASDTDAYIRRDVSTQRHSDRRETEPDAHHRRDVTPLPLQQSARREIVTDARSHRDLSPGPSRQAGYRGRSPAAAGDEQVAPDKLFAAVETFVDYELPVLLSSRKDGKTMPMKQDEPSKPPLEFAVKQEVPSVPLGMSIGLEHVKTLQIRPSSPEQTPEQMPEEFVQPTPVQTEEMEMDNVLAQRGFTICKHKVYHPGLPAGVLGKGSFGSVYKAIGNGSAWAVKKIDNAATYYNMIQKEVEVLRLLNGHPNIVSLADAVAHPPRDWLFIVMEFVEGGDLLGALTKSPQIFDESLVRAMMFHISCGLGFAHAVGVMHRDLKPENVLLGRDLVPKLADFGLSRSVGMMEFCQTVAGTPGYMAPEVMTGCVPYDFPADVYSMGLVFADMLSDKTCLEWFMGGRPECEQERFRKKWPVGFAPQKYKSVAIIGMQKRAICQAPGERITAYQLCVELLALEKSDPKPCKLWSVPTKMPQGPPVKRMVSPTDAAEIAGRLGYAKGASVHVQVGGQMREGKVEHISTTLCPGAAQVRYKAPEGEKTMLVCPWEFATTLRPCLQEAPGAERSEITCQGDDAGEATARTARTRGLRSSSSRRRSKSRQLTPSAKNIKCKVGACSIQ